MTLAAYQDAFAHMVLAPRLCVSARERGVAAFEGFDLTPAEARRLAAIAAQPGMKITCILARANRLSSLVGALPLTCALLKPELSQWLDRFWDEQPMRTLQALPAGVAFGRFLQREIEEGRLRVRYAPEVLAFELTALDLQRMAHTESVPATGAARLRVMEFPFDPSPLLSALAQHEPVPQELGARPTQVVLDYQRDPPQTYVLRPEYG
jgi:hypothetical protein